MGRPKIEIDLEKVRQLAARGLTEQQIAHALGISIATIGRRKQDTEDFSEAIKRGKAEGIAAMANIVTKQALSGNLTAAIFYLKCRGGWREKDDLPSDEPRKIAADIRVALAEMNERTAGKTEESS